MRTRSALQALVAFLLCTGGAACSSSAPSPVAAQVPATVEAPVAAAAIPAVDPELARKLDALAASVERARVAQHLPGLALAIVKDDALVFARGFGLADVEAQRPVTPETIFAIGSTTKAFTATLVGMLADEGKIAFDDPVTETLPWFELKIDGKGPVLVRDLLAHRTGFARMDILWAGGKLSTDDVLRTALKAEPMAPFRSKFLYNNIMFLAAGTCCAAVAGSSWEELLHARILEPLGMRDSTTNIQDAQRDPRLALGYDWNKEQERFERKPMRDLHAIAPAGALNSNVLDLARWVRFLLANGEFEGRRLISAAQLAEEWKPANKVTAGIDYGLGWMLGRWNGAVTRSHGGNIDGFAASIWLLPDRRTGIALLTNVTQTGLQDGIGPLVFEALYGAPPAATEPAAAATAPEDLDRFTGVYLANFAQFQGAEFRVLVRDGKLAIDIPGQTTFELAPPGADGKRPFAILPEQIQVSFVEAAPDAPSNAGAPEVVALVLYQGGCAFECWREGYERPPEAEPADLARYLGAYADPMSGKTLTVIVQDGRLALDYPGQMVYELRPPDAEGKWTFHASDAFAVEFQLDADDRAESLTFHERGTTRECERTGDGPGAPRPLDEVLAKHRGAEFEARLAALGPCRTRSKLRFVHCGIEGTSTITFDARGRFRDETDLEPFAHSVTSCDGARVVTESSLEPTRELLDASRDSTLGASTLAFFGDWVEHYDEGSVVQTVREGERELALVKLVKGKAPPLRVFVDLATGDVARAEVQEIVDGAGTFAKKLTFEDWRDFEGLRLPGRVISEDDAAGRIVFEIVGLDTGVDAAVLDAPLPVPDGGK